MTMRETLLSAYDRMLEHHGPQRWWPGDTRFEIMVGAVLTQAAAWTNVEKAISNLMAAGVMSPQAMRELDQETLARLVYPSGYFNSKARKLKALVEFLGERFDDDLEAMAGEDADTLRRELLEVYGIGEETADDILLYALDKAACVVDTYTKRIFFRLGLAPERGVYSTYRSLFMEHLPAELQLLREYHALIVRHGKEVCRRRPLCSECCLLQTCPTGKGVTAAG